MRYKVWNMQEAIRGEGEPHQGEEDENEDADEEQVEVAEER